MSLTLAFMGTPDFAVPALKSLIDAGHRVRRVYTQPPRPAGRGQQAKPTPVHRAAEALGLDVAHPESLRDEAVLDGFRRLGLDAAVVVAYGLVLPKPYLDAPKFGCVNIHASLLPRWRGAAPIQRAILAGDAQTGVSIMQMAPGLDDGPVILAEPTPITVHTTAGALHDELSQLGARLVLEALDGLQAGTLHPKPQPDEGVTYAAKLEKAEGLIDWSDSAASLDRRLRALTPWPGCFFEREAADPQTADGRTERLKLIAAHPAGGLGRPQKPGIILDRQATIACGQGALRLDRVQRPGRKPVSGEEFLRGARLEPGDSL